MMSAESNEITIRSLNENSISDFEYLARWQNDPEIKHFIRPHRDAESMQWILSAESLQADYLERLNLLKAKKLYSWSWMICVNGIPVGDASLMLNPTHAVTQNMKVAWAGLEVGEAQWRHKGLGHILMDYLESEALKHGCDVMEVGVFEFNKASLNFFKKRGYEIITRLINFTYWQGRMWDDVRLLNKLS